MFEVVSNSGLGAGWKAKPLTFRGASRAVGTMCVELAAPGY